MMEYFAKRRPNKKSSRRRANSEVLFGGQYSYSDSFAQGSNEHHDVQKNTQETSEIRTERVQSGKRTDEEIFTEECSVSTIKEEEIPSISRKFRNSLSVSQSGRIKSKTRQKLALFPDDKPLPSPRNRSLSVPSSFDGLFTQSGLKTHCSSGPSGEKRIAKDELWSLDVNKMHASSEHKVTHTDNRILCDLAF